MEPEPTYAFGEFLACRAIPAELRRWAPVDPEKWHTKRWHTHRRAPNRFEKDGIDLEVDYQGKWRITDRQMALLDSLVCERLSAHPESNIALLASFEKDPNGRIGPLSHLQLKGAEEDAINSVAVYLVKDRHGRGLFAFSLKCGELYDQVSEEIEAVKSLKKAFFDHEEIRGLPYSEKASRFRKFCHDKLVKPQHVELVLKMFKDLSSGKEGRIKHVSKTISGILLVDFCKNFGASEDWKKLGLGTDRPMGEILFWKFVAPIVVNASKIVGCEYMFLYAADLTEDGQLINYYSGSLNFKREHEFGTNKPTYDLLCPLMSQRVSDMELYMNVYFDNFNMSPECDFA